MLARVAFNPKYVSEYNNREELLAKKKKSNICFEARKVAFDNRNLMRVSYETRVERENLRMYNG